MIIDNILNISINKDDSFNELNMLESLKFGLTFLYDSVDAIEAPRRNSDAKSGVMNTCWGRDPQSPPYFINSSASIFAWYSISTINYVRLVGFLKGLSEKKFSREELYINRPKPIDDKIKATCNDYINTIPEIADVWTWRNKVAAHFALTDPKKEDNPATLEASIIHPVGYSNGRYRTAVFTHIRGDDQNEFSSQLPSWSLTEVHTQLSKRYSWKSV
jgi:hypothetical protein